MEGAGSEPEEPDRNERTVVVSDGWRPWFAEGRVAVLVTLIVSMTLTVSAERCRLNVLKFEVVNELGDLVGMLESSECRGTSSSALGSTVILFVGRSDDAGTSRDEGLRCFFLERDVEYLYAGQEREGGSKNPSAW